MLIGFFTYNSITEDIFIKTTELMEKEVIDLILSEFTSASKKGTSLITEMFTYYFLEKEDVYYVLVTEYGFQEYNAIKLLKTLIPYDFPSLLFVLDDIINKNSFFILDTESLHNIVEMESQEEKIHEMMMKNKELDAIQKQKELKMRKKMSDIDLQLEKVKNLEIEIRKETILQSKTVEEKEEIKKEKKPVINEDREESILIGIKEKIKIVVDKENNIKNCEVEGDMNLLVRNEEYKNCEIEFSIQKKENLKFNPNLDKDSSKKNKLKGTKGFPVDKNVALMKWKYSEIFLPIVFTFWPSEVGIDKYQISMEIVTEVENCEGLKLFFPLKNIKNVILESDKCVLGKEFIEWDIGSCKERGSSENIEFTCSTDDVNNVFPIEVFFRCKSIFSGLKILNVKEKENLDCFSVDEMFEVDKFTIVNE
ncbi:subunit delta of coatomer complex [Hamiltosporidium tvaerminnensis]|uniref:Coatomer subunit delta n=3 Tax=Hamiltosporidium TaxID=1176354 RepID=A0A4Q9L371_9MICR|nr:hypothetical protein LUQ84_001511 [Hamiltosporidium tvaerminnensis]TBU01311.1 subunit delta of coatomer complex [Hamiltosporidium tvaerminnensis]TBU12109.1 subunit delta of coatomer complex [Hamiltosporidium tvaerminnensis]